MDGNARTGNKPEQHARGLGHFPGQRPVSGAGGNSACGIRQSPCPIRRGRPRRRPCARTNRAAARLQRRVLAPWESSRAHAWGRSSVNAPDIPYPSPGIRHSRCVLALTATQACLDVFRPAADCGAALKQQLDKIGRRDEACAQQTRKKSLSAGDKRDTGRKFEILGRYMTSEDMTDEIRFRRRAALIRAALTFIEDACNACPVCARTPQ